MKHILYIISVFCLFNATLFGQNQVADTTDLKLISNINKGKVVTVTSTAYQGDYTATNVTQTPNASTIFASSVRNGWYWVKVQDALKLSTSDTAASFAPFIERSDTASMLTPYISRNDTAAAFIPFIERSDTATMLLSRPSRRKLNTIFISDHGAIVDDGLSDRDAIVSALEKADATPGHDIIFFDLQGRYFIDTTDELITGVDSITLDFNNNELFFESYQGLTGDNFKIGFRFFDTKNIRIKNFFFNSYGKYNGWQFINDNTPASKVRHTSNWLPLQIGNQNFDPFGDSDRVQDVKLLNGRVDSLYYFTLLTADDVEIRGVNTNYCAWTFGHTLCDNLVMENCNDYIDTNVMSPTNTLNHYLYITECRRAYYNNIFMDADTSGGWKEPIKIRATNSSENGFDYPESDIKMTNISLRYQGYTDLQAGINTRIDNWRIYFPRFVNNLFVCNGDTNRLSFGNLYIETDGLDRYGGTNEYALQYYVFTVGGGVEFLNPLFFNEIHTVGSVKWRWTNGAPHETVINNLIIEEPLKDSTTGGSLISIDQSSALNESTVHDLTINNLLVKWRGEKGKSTQNYNFASNAYSSNLRINNGRIITENGNTLGNVFIVNADTGKTIANIDLSDALYSNLLNKQANYDSTLTSITVLDNNDRFVTYGGMTTRINNLQNRSGNSYLTEATGYIQDSLYTQSFIDSALISQGYRELNQNDTLKTADFGKILYNDDATNDTLYIPTGITADVFSQYVGIESYSSSSIVIISGSTQLRDIENTLIDTLTVKAAAIRRVAPDKFRLLSSSEVYITASDTASMLTPYISRNDTAAMLASYSKTDDQTLQEVTDEGATTTNAITTGGLTIGNNQLLNIGASDIYESTGEDLIISTNGVGGANDGNIQIVGKDGSATGYVAILPGTNNIGILTRSEDLGSWFSLTAKNNDDAVFTWHDNENTVGDLIFKTNAGGNAFVLDSAGNGTFAGDLDVLGGAEIDGVTTFNDSTSGISYTDLSDTPNLDSLLALYNLKTGWAHYIDTAYATAADSFYVAQGSTVTLPIKANMADGLVTTYLPNGVDSLFSQQDSTILGIATAATYTVRINFKAKNSSNTGYATLALDIGTGGTPNIATAESLVFPKGAGVETQESKTILLYSLDTFIANGCKIKVTADTGNLEIYDIRLLIRLDSRP